MVKYVCYNCHKEFSHKGNYQRHINRKNKCKKIEKYGNISNKNNNIPLIERSIERSIFVRSNEKRTKNERKTNENRTNAYGKNKNTIKKNISPSENYDSNFNNYSESIGSNNNDDLLNFSDKDEIIFSDSEENIPKLECTFQKWNNYSNNGISKKNARKTNENRTKLNMKYFSNKKNRRKSNNASNNNTSDKNSYYYNGFKCIYCDKMFTKKYNLNKHFNRCKNKKIDEEDTEKEMLKQMLEIKDLELKKQNQELEDAKRKIKELSKSSNNVVYNTVNNITLIAYNRQPDLSHLTNNDYVKIMNRGFNSVPQLIKAIHFNPKKPQNQNIFIPNIKSKYVMVWNGIKWDLINRKDVIDDMYDDSSNILIEKMEELKHADLKPTVLKKFERFIDKKEDDEVKNKIKEDIKLLLYNNKEIVKNK